MKLTIVVAIFQNEMRRSAINELSNPLNSVRISHKVGQIRKGTILDQVELILC